MKHMIATEAYHGPGDISREGGDICAVYSETDTHYVGNWVTGFGFIGVKFPKETTRELTPEEVEYCSGLYLQMGDYLPTPFRVRG